MADHGALRAACWRGRVDEAVLLLDRGVDVDGADGQGRTALYYASGYGQTAAATLLLDRGADVERAQREGVTPLYVRAVLKSKTGRVVAAV